MSILMWLISKPLSLLPNMRRFESYEGDSSLTGLCPEIFPSQSRGSSYAVQEISVEGDYKPSKILLY